MTDRRGPALVASLALVGGCLVLNPDYSDGDVGASSSVGTGGGTTGAAAATGGASSSAGETTRIGTDTVGATGGTTDATTTGMTGTTGTTGEPPPACGPAGYGEAMMLARRYDEGVAQDCVDEPGANYKITGFNMQTSLLSAIRCSSDPALGCSDCDASKVLALGITTPEPQATISVNPCVYLAYQGKVDPVIDQDPCRWKSMGVWHDGTSIPAKVPPLAVLGHLSLAVPAKVPELHLDTMLVEISNPAPCSCVDPGDCCADMAKNYELIFSSGNAMQVLGPGTLGAYDFAGASYTAYNGDSKNTGECVNGDHVDWWIFRQ